VRGKSWQVGAVLAFVALAPRAAFATAYYVNDRSTAGDRAFPGCASMGPGQASAPCGTCARPCDSPQLAYDANPVGPGDTIYLNAGRYSPDAGSPGLALTVPGKEGALGAPLTVEGLLDPSGRCARDDAGVPLVLMDGQNTGTVGVFITVSFITVKGFGITDMEPSGNEPYGSGVRILGPEDAPDGGLPDAGPTGWVVTGMDIYGLRGFGASPVDIDTWAPSCPGCEVSWNRLHDCPSCSAAVWIQGPPDVRVVGNEIFANSFFTTGTPAQIYLAGAPSPVVRNNLVYGNGGDALGLLGCGNEELCGSQVSSPAQVLNNTFWRNAQVSQDADTAEIALEDGSDRARFFNNLIGFDRAPAFYSDGTGLSASDYNGFLPLGDAGYAALGGVDVHTLLDWQGQGFDLNGLEADPLFVAPGSDFHLASTAGFFDPSGILHAGASTSPFLDWGDLSTPIGAQRLPHQGRVNAGAYGGTAEASLTPVKLAAVGGDGQHADPGEVLSQPLAVAVRFESGAGAAGVQVAFEVTSGEGQVSPAFAVTDETGLASTQLKLGRSPTTTVRASLPRVLGAGEVSFTSTADLKPPSHLGVSCGGCSSLGSPAWALAALLWAFALARRPRLRP
jgi:hypothetical protein